MRSTRRRFLASSGLASAGLLVPGRSVLARIPGAREPAPSSAPPSGGHAHAALADSALLKDEKLALHALDAARKKGASFADVRLVLWRRENLGVRDDHISRISRSEEYGIGLRVIADGAWGFAATNLLDRTHVNRVVDQAIATAKVNAKLLKRPVQWAPAPAVLGTWVSPYEVDPFTVPLQEKADLLIQAARGALGVKGVRFVRAGVRVLREEKLYINSEGSRLHQMYFRLNPSLSATAVDRRRGGFASRDHEGQPMLGGWEHVAESRLIEDAPQIGADAVIKLHAASVEPGTKDVILLPSNLWLTIHESIGHPTELDRALGLEANFAGTSFITPDQTGKLQLGSERVNLVADRTQPGGLATTGWDDDGVASQRWDMVKNGRFVGWQTTRDQAGWIGEAASRGCSYGDSYGSVAFQRMPNISLQPGPEGYTTEDLINATEDGIVVSGRGSWSIDHQRYNFQFGGQFFWEVKNGRLTRPLKDVAYQANSVDFWRSCDMLGGADTYRLGASFSDGKGEPGQSNGVSHGCPPARFRVNILNTGEQE
ncbi:MAG: TldD/PmbA family protein [Nannocystaceae bacterium]